MTIAVSGEMVFIPSPGIGHIVPTIELAKLLVGRDCGLSVTILIIKHPREGKSLNYLSSLSASTALKLVYLPEADLSSPRLSAASNVSHNFLVALVEASVHHARAVAFEIARSADGPGLAGIVVDMFCTAMMGIAEELAVPSYTFFTSSASFLGLYFHAQKLRDEQDIELSDLGSELEVPTFAIPFPTSVLPSVMVEKKLGSATFLAHARDFRKSSGILVNTFGDLEAHALEFFRSSFPEFPPVYHVGPLLGIHADQRQRDEVNTWLDEQPDSSVVFLCFGGFGSFGKDQVHQIAIALERTRHRFLWSLRQPPEEKLDLPTDYTDLREVMPEGFLERTSGVGRVMGWATQVEVLAHRSIGGFVSHCGWNSVLESLWYGVPMATWPMYAEQQANAFQLVRELRLAVEITVDYRKDDDVVIPAEVVEKRIRILMENSVVRSRVAEMRDMCRAAVMEGGSSYASVGQFLQQITDFDAVNGF